MPRDNSSSYQSNAAERGFFLAICSVLTAGILYGLNSLLAEHDAAGDDASSAATAASGAGDE
jgi:hypothetical protein